MIQDKKIQDETMDSDLCIHESDTNSVRLVWFMVFNATLNNISVKKYKE
jgi:hypothetical protein